MARNSYWLSALVLLSLPSWASEATPDTDPSLYQRGQQWFARVLEELGADGGFDPDKGIDWSVMPGPFYTPEKSLGIGVSTVGLYLPDRNDTVSQPSSITINGFGSINGSLGIGVESRTFLKEDKYRLFIDAELQDAPDVFYGIGMDNGREVANLVNFELTEYRFKPQAMMRVLPSTYIGAGFDLVGTKAREIDADAPQPIGTAPAAQFPEKSFSAGPSLHLVHDSRDFILNASEGRLLQADVVFYDEAFGSDSDFQKVTLNYSDYMTLDVVPGILAWQWIGEFNHGDVPWDQMATLGGANRLRGYEQGRYRDRQMTLAQVEYRQPLRGRHGMVYWVGAGTLADRVSELGDEKWLHTLGVGYRFEIKQRVNLRLDMGFGNGENGFYFAVNEAF
ncbi:BamA/TamA family outer membrane protein [Ferrimonas balearica]|uniref:BamA/TamA family outer membrane protein n=1 Tax=Ferrimonas balearica TaxID=44012 RepID=UPI001FEEB15D|nr:BamA/TamA family outer membrane protein [Ferrimonas balearica]